MLVAVVSGVAANLPMRLIFARGARAVVLNVREAVGRLRRRANILLISDKMTNSRYVLDVIAGQVGAVDVATSKLVAIGSS